MPSIDGLVTGIDTTKIITGLLSIHQKQIDLLTSRKKEVVDEQTAFKGIEGQLLSLRGQIGVLARGINSVFAAKSATSSNEQLVAAAASETAAPGTYTLRVSNLAQAHQVATQGFADADSAITQGTFSVQVGSGQTFEVAIDSTNNTLQGLADAINASGAGVSATIVNDGSTGGASYRLLLASSKTGAANGLTITNNLAADSGGAVKPLVDTLNPIQEAADATILFGAGAGAITVKSETNSVDGLIQGVALNLLDADDTKTVTISVTRDTEAAETAIVDFVDSFNKLMAGIDNQVRFDAATNTASVLLGNRSVISIQDEVRRALTEVVAGADPAANRLSTIGITVDLKGQLSVNTAKLKSALSGQVEGITADSMRRLFALDGQSDNGNVQFLLGSSKTKPTTTGYQVDITQAAERAAIVGASDVAASTVIDGTNNTFDVTVDGKVISGLTLTAGTYTQEELAAHVKSVINASAAGRTVGVSVQSNKLQITSDSYGASSEVTIGAGSAIAALGFAGTETDRGVDVAGSFIVNGVSEAATGSGRLLSGNSTNANTASLQLRVTLTAAQVQAGVDATVTVSRGIASRLDQVLGNLLDPVSGRTKTVNDGFDEKAEAFQKDIEKQNKIFESRQEALLKQFAALESSVGQLQSIGNLLAASFNTVSSVGLSK